MQPDATSAQKLGGALMNAIIFICVIAAMTVVLFILFKYGVRLGAWRMGCMHWMRVYMGRMCGHRPTCKGVHGALPPR